MAKANPNLTLSINDAADAVSHALNKVSSILTVMSEAKDYCQDNTSTALAYLSNELFEAKKALDTLSDAALEACRAAANKSTEGARS
jgi:hypothetical protein